tara:strand:- start:1265 stop:1423 length:159 start_codon:yes stop_codon:yes gene_type:complete
MMSETVSQPCPEHGRVRAKFRITVSFKDMFAGPGGKFNRKGGVIITLRPNKK